MAHYRGALSADRVSVHSVMPDCDHSQREPNVDGRQRKVRLADLRTFVETLSVMTDFSLYLLDSVGRWVRKGF
jgi:hypothetical protein